MEYAGSGYAFLARHTDAEAITIRQISAYDTSEAHTMTAMVAMPPPK